MICIILLKKFKRSKWAKEEKKNLTTSERNLRKDKKVNKTLGTLKITTEVKILEMMK